MNDKQKTEWLAALKQGDEVVVYGNHPRLGTVDRATRTQIQVGGFTYRRDNGHGHGHWTSSLHEPTQELRDQIEQRALVGQLQNLNWRLADAATLRAVAAVLELPEPNAQGGVSQIPKLRTTGTVEQAYQEHLDSEARERASRKTVEELVREDQA